MLNKKVEKALNDQIKVESESSQAYLAMASWAERSGYAGTSAFLYKHSDEERLHMLKLIKFVNDRGGKAIVPALAQQPTEYKNLQQIFKLLLEHETHVTAEINNVVHVCRTEKDYTTDNFMQWYLTEQIEEETLASAINDKLRLAGDDKGAIYLFDSELAKAKAAPKTEAA
ncbi:MAG: ferritin [Flavobacteriales bacterium]